MIKKGYELEVEFWDWVINPATRKPFVQKRLDVDKQDFLDNCGEFFFNLLSHYKQAKPRLLDVGAGPVSRLMWGAVNGMVNVVPVDPLADEYKEILKKYSIQIPIIPERGCGETLVEQFGRDSFDIVYCCNALDHSERPLLVAMNMACVLKTGGFLMVEGFTKEAIHEKFVGLHQHNLWVEENKLWYSNKEIDKVMVFSNYMHCVYASSADTEPGTWFKIIFQKTNDT